MIQSVILENFQSHKYSTFNFDKGLNVIVGAGHQGKTSLVRALSLVLYNNWDKSWVRVGATFCRVILTMDNGVTVIREKGDKVNKYILSAKEYPNQEFNNFGTDVPEAISKALRIGKVVLDKDDSLTLNYAGQHEPLFLFNRSGSQKAKVFGKLSGAHYLDHAMRSLSVEKKQISVEKSLKSKELVELKLQYSTLSAVSAFSPKIQELEIKNTALDTASYRISELKALLLRVQQWKMRYTSEAQLEAVLGQAKGVEIDSVAERVQRLKELKNLQNRVSDLSGRENALKSTLSELRCSQEHLQAEYLKALSENKICPTCFTSLDGWRLNEIQENLAGSIK